MKNFLQIFLLTLSLIGASMTHSADIVSDDSIESNQTVSIQKKSFIDHIKQFITEHKKGIGLVGLGIFCQIVGYSLANKTLQTNLKKGLVTIMPFLANEPKVDQPLITLENTLTAAVVASHWWFVYLACKK